QRATPVVSARSSDARSRFAGGETITGSRKSFSGGSRPKSSRRPCACRFARLLECAGAQIRGRPNRSAISRRVESCRGHERPGIQALIVGKIDNPSKSQLLRAKTDRVKGDFVLTIEVRRYFDVRAGALKLG